MNKVLVEYENTEENNELAMESHSKLIKEMTKSYQNSVFEILDEVYKAKEQSRALFKFQVIVYLIIATRATNKNIYSTINNFKSIGFNLEKFSKLSEKQISDLMPSILFKNNKARNIKITCDILNEQFSGDPPETSHEITALSGIGPVMKDVYLNLIFETGKFLTVTGHVQRVANRLNWTTFSDFKSIKPDLEAKIPKEHWEEFNILLDNFGQSVCTKTDPLCYNCLLKDSCPAKSNGTIGQEKLKRSRIYKEEIKAKADHLINKKLKKKDLDLKSNSDLNKQANKKIIKNNKITPPENSLTGNNLPVNEFNFDFRILL